MSDLPDQTFHSFEDFWPFYVREHSDPTNRALHFVGTTLAVTSAAAGLLTGRRGLLLAAPVLGYGFAWIGHFVVEKNRPATFEHPLWSLRGDFRMWWKIATGTMAAEVGRAATSNGVDHEDAGPPSHVGAQAAN
jgi:hypothetical protein